MIRSSIAELHDSGSRGNTQSVTRRLQTQRLVLAHPILATELVDATAGVNDLLLAGVERVTGGANLYKKVLTKRGARRKFVATTTGDLDVGVIGVNIGFHFGSPERATWRKGRVGYSEASAAASPQLLSTEPVDKTVDAN